MMGRKVGPRIREVLEIVEAGATTKAEIRELMSADYDPSHVSMYCTRAVSMGLMICDSSCPVRYSVAPAWRAMADRKAYKSTPAVNSVFALGLV